MGTTVPMVGEAYIRCEVWSCSSFMKVGGSLAVFASWHCAFSVSLIFSERWSWLLMPVALRGLVS